MKAYSPFADMKKVGSSNTGTSDSIGSSQVCPARSDEFKVRIDQIGQNIIQDNRPHDFPRAASHPSPSAWNDFKFDENDAITIFLLFAAVVVVLAYVLSIRRKRHRHFAEVFKERLGESMSPVVESLQETQKALEVLNEKIDWHGRRSEMLMRSAIDMSVLDRAETLDHISRIGSGFIDSMSSIASAENDRLVELIESNLLENGTRIQDLRCRLQYLETEVETIGSTIQMKTDREESRAVQCDLLTPSVCSEVNKDDCEEAQAVVYEDEKEQLYDADHEGLGGATDEFEGHELPEEQVIDDCCEDILMTRQSDSFNDVACGLDDDELSSSLSSLGELVSYIRHEDNGQPTDEETMESGVSCDSEYQRNNFPRKINSFTIQLNFHKM